MGIKNKQVDEAFMCTVYGYYVTIGCNERDDGW